MNTKIRSVLWLGILTICLVSGNSFDAMTQNAPVTTIGTVINAVSNEQVMVPVIVTGFTNIAMGTLTIEYDYTKIQFNSSASVINPILAGFAAIGDNDLPVPDGIHHRLVIAWISDPVVTLSAGSSIVNLAFKYISGSTSLQFIDISTDFKCEYNDIDWNPLNDTPTSTYYINGSVSAPSSSVLLNAKVFLEGPYAGAGLMSTTLRSVMPLTQPYNTAPWNYAGTESVTSIPANVTDWVLVQLRTGTTSATTVYTCAGFLRNDGMITGLDGTSLLTLPNIAEGSYYIVIKHRNHLAVMSANPVLLSATSELYNFSLAQTQAYGTTPQKTLVGGVFGMFTGDGNSDGTVTIADRNLWRTNSGSVGYLKTDFNMDFTVTVADFNKWRSNSGSASQVP